MNTAVKYSLNGQECVGDNLIDKNLFTITDQRGQFQLNKALKGNMLTISNQKPPDYYIKMIRYHFLHNSEQLCLQALGLSSTNLVQVACLATLKGYAQYKKIKNDHITVPIADSKTGKHVGLMKKVRLSVKLRKAEDFLKILQEESAQAIQFNSQNSFYSSYSRVNDQSENNYRHQDLQDDISLVN